MERVIKMVVEWTKENRAWLVEQVIGTLYECTANDVDVDIDDNDLISILEQAIEQLKTQS